MRRRKTTVAGVGPVGVGPVGVGAAVNMLLSAMLLTTFCATAADAQYQPPSEKLIVTTDHASSWTEGSTTILLIDSPLTIELDRATISGKQAVIWLTPTGDGVMGQQRAQIAVIGDAKLDEPMQQLERTGDRLYITAYVRANIRLVAETRSNENQSDSDLYRQALSMRPIGTARTPAGVELDRPWNDAIPATQPATQPTSQPFPREPVHSVAQFVERTQTADGRVAFVLSGNVFISQARANGDLLELRADRAVLFTQLHQLKEASDTDRFGAAEDAMEAAYLEGDVRIAYTPSAAKRPEQRLTAQRVYYEFTTDRAVLTQAVVHSLEPQRQIPITVRAQLVRQLSTGEYRADNAELSTSQLVTPTFSMHAQRAYVRQLDTGDPRYGAATVFVTHDTTLKAFGVPYFWLPIMSGSMTERGTALRSLYTESSSRFGIGVRSEWGLFETLGILPPDDLDIGYRADYFAKRGPAGGLSADYQGGYITETTREPWDFKGDFRSYLVNDHGDDRLGSERRVVVPPDEIRGQFQWEHQHFFPGDWQIQARVGYTSDPTFLEEYFQKDFDTGLPHDASLLIKRQRDTEALTLTIEMPTNNFPTVADEFQEQVQVERVPELGYQRIGDSFGDDAFTFFSNNRVGLLHFRKSGADLLEEGFRHGQDPGIPSIARTGINDDTNLRGDFRQEIDYPFQAGQFKISPYVVGRFTGYSDTPDGGGRNRILLGTGARINTAFWKVDDTAESDLFDIHRLRHVIEPEINFFTSAATHDQSDFFDYDEPVDAINDVTALQLALHQRWQTQRGGAGQFRSVDFFTFNIEANFFTNQPNDNLLNPTGFRGLYFPSVPEESVARNGINSDALWRISDTTLVLADEEYNLDKNRLATTSIGLAIQRDPRMSYFVGLRYIGEINSTIASLAATYELSMKYSFAFNQSFNLSDRKNENSSVTIIRHFDRLFLTFTLYYDAVDKESGFRFGFIPEGLGPGANSDTLNQIVGPQQ